MPHISVYLQWSDQPSTCSAAKMRTPVSMSSIKMIYQYGVRIVLSISLEKQPALVISLAGRGVCYRYGHVNKFAIFLGWKSDTCALPVVV